MTVHYGGMDISFTAAEDLSAMQYRFVHQASDTTVDMVDSATEIPVGILQNAPESGEAAVVRVTGISKLVMNAAVAVSKLVKCEYVGASDNGKGDAVDTDGDYTAGLVVKASGAEDDIGAVLLTCGRASYPTGISTSASVSPSASSSASSSASASASASTSASPSASQSPSSSTSASPSSSASSSTSASASPSS